MAIAEGRASVRRTPSTTGEGRGSWLALTLAQVWAMLAVSLPALVALLTRLNSVDLAYHLRLGASILAHGSIPRADSFTFSPLGASSGASSAHTWVDQQWAAQIILWLAARAGGWGGEAVLRAGLVAATFGFLFLACREAGAGSRTAGLLTLAGFVVAQPGLMLRPQLFGLVLLTATAWLLAARRRRPGLVLAIPVIAAAWANLHGTFVLAPLLVVLAWLDARRTAEPRANRLLWVAIAAAAATLANPFGTGAWAYVVDIATNPVIRGTIAEWQRPSIQDAGGVVFYASVLAVGAFLIARRGATPWPALAAIGALFVLAASANRSVLVWALIVPAVLAGELAPPRADAASVDRAPVNIAIVGALALAIVAALPGVMRPADSTWWLPSDIPIALTTRLTRVAHPGDRALVAQPWASWVEYAVPQVRVFVDSRIELFDPSAWRQYRTVIAGRPGWEAVLQRWDVDELAVPNVDATIEARLRSDPGWRRVYFGADGAIFIRSGTS